jgi:hypothetical protein
MGSSNRRGPRRSGQSRRSAKKSAFRDTPDAVDGLSHVTVPRLAVGALTAGVMLIATLMFDVGPAAADTPGCVTRAEYGRVRDGMTRGKVHDIFDTNGTPLFEKLGRSA